MTDVSGRTYGFAGDQPIVDLCEHVSVVLRQNYHPVYEYTDTMEIYCKVCQTMHNVTLFIN